ncbi:unnamed protein product [Cyclocybe aegerita]|uniref:Uncharacterized protein n=1 Tax=Cyclocybe aegerita TaxID=1973307 RepID=A0A8S0VZ03_CYCAE|nr:unnamed protein product [Cyclocybe aegerita]
MASSGSSQLPPPSPTRPMPRRRSLRLPVQPLEIPVPPTLRHSPYLNSPIFQGELTSPRLPSEAAERWLQDTVPQKFASATEGGSPQTARCNMDRRGSIVQLSRRAYHKVDVDWPTRSSQPGLGSPQSPAPLTHSRSKSQTTAKYLSHSLAPPPASPPPLWTFSPNLQECSQANRLARLPKTQSDPNIPRNLNTNASRWQEDQGYFSHVPSTR